MPPPRVTLLKRDSLGRVELLEHDGARYVRRVACGGRIPGSRWVARLLLRRERRALAALAGLAGVPAAADATLAGLADGPRPDPCGVLLRTFIAGQPLHRATHLAENFFDQLDQLVADFHARGVCHNDLHKEQNVVVDAAGYPALIDFQLASVHQRLESRTFRIRCKEDLRHVQKHRRRYTRDGRGPASAAAEHGAAYGARRSPLARAWRRAGKPLYIALTRGLLRTRDGEERRASSGPWPQWVAPLAGRSTADTRGQPSTGEPD